MESELFVTASLPELLESFQKAEQSLDKQVAWWYRLHIWLQLISVGLGILAAIMIAMQSDQNAWIVRPLGLISTILAGGIVTVYNIFHIRETIDELLKIQGDMLLHMNELDTLVRKNNISGTLSPLDLIDIEESYAAILNALGRRRRSLMGSIGGILQTNEGMKRDRDGPKLQSPVQNS